MWVHHIIEFYSDENSRIRDIALFSLEDEHTLGAKSSYVKCNNDHFISKPILQSTPEFNITHWRKPRNSNVFETDESLTMNTCRMSDRTSPTYIKSGTLDCSESYLDRRLHVDAYAMYCSHRGIDPSKKIQSA